MISPVLTFAIFSSIALRDSSTLDVSRLFTSLSLVLLLTQPLFYVFLGIEQLMSALGCFERIGAFLEKESVSDHRLKLRRVSVKQETAHDSIWPPESYTGTFGIEMAALGAVIAGKNRPSATVVPSSSVTDETQAIVVKDGTFGWTKNGEPILHDVNFTIRPSTLNILIGPVASGKSTLLKALLGETPSSKGFVHISTREIAWCEQIPWLIVSKT